MPWFVPKTEALLTRVSVSKEQIINIINNFSSNKAHCYDGISVSMLKICTAEIVIPLQIIFLDCINSGIFPDCWKFANVQPIYKKSSQMKNNYRPISLLPICGKILEKIVFDQVYAFLSVDNLLSQNHSGFRPGDSTIFQLLSITSTIYDSFEKYDETRAVFLDISKAFDKVWHEGIIFKLKCNGISRNLLNLFEHYLLNRFQLVVSNGNESNWTSLKTGVPQGSVSGPLLFLIYINDLTDNISSDMRLFADDSSLFTCVKGVTQSHHKLLKDLQTVTFWAYQWKMVFNPDITKQAIEVIFSYKKKPAHPDLTFNGVPVSREPFTKHLGVYLDSRLNFCKHVKEHDLSYKMYVRPHLDYGEVIFHNQRMDLMDLIERVQYKAALIVSGCWQGTSRVKLYDELGWESLSDRRWARRMTIFYKINNGLAPTYLSEHIPQRNDITFNLRNRVDSTPFIGTSMTSMTIAFIRILLNLGKI